MRFSIPGSVEADGSADYKGDCFGFRLTHYLGCGDSPLCLVQHLVGDFVNKGAELLRWRLTGKQNDLASVAHAQRRGDAFFELKQDVLGCEDSTSRILESLSTLSFQFGCSTCRAIWDSTQAA